jgi:hypothetical protein
MKHAKDLKNAPLAELDEWEASWRDSAEGWLTELPDALPSPEELDQLNDDDHALSVVESVALEAAELGRAIEGDALEWAKVAIARIKARAKVNKKAA